MLSKQLDKQSSKPLYVQLKEIVRGQLPNEQDKNRVRLPSERKLANTYGVSRMTARQALKSLGEELAIQRNGQGTFFSQPGERTLKMLRFVFPKNWNTLSQSTFYSNIFLGAEAQAHKYGCDLLFSTLDADNALINKIKDTDAVILVGERNRTIINKIFKTGCSLCLVDCDVPDKNEGWDQVVIDNKQGAEIAADALINSNHQKCAYIDCYVTPPSFAFRQRHESFASRLHEHGLPFTDDDCFKMNFESNEENTARVLDSLIERQYTAAFASHSHFALDLLALAKKRNINNELSLIGFGEDDLSKKLGLSTICIPEPDIGKIAIEQIIKSYDNNWCLKQTSLISTHYSDRGSIHTL